jgi:hypothetical protein
MQQVYGADNPSQVDKINLKRKQTFIERFGGDNPSSSSIVVSKRQATFEQRFGGTSPMASSEVREKLRQTNLQRYGVEYSQQSPSIRAKTSKTNIERYGSQCNLNHPAIKHKAKVTLKQNYGVTSPLNSDVIRAKMIETNLERYGVTNVASRPVHRELMKITRRKAWLSDRLKAFAHIATPCFDPEAYDKVDHLYLWQCVMCGRLFQAHIDNGGFPRCPSCHRGRSKPEFEIREWLETLGLPVTYNDRKQIAPFELDFLFPGRALAVEFNGLYYHSEIAGLHASDYHLNKTIMCREKSIQLLHIFDDEWSQQALIVKDLIQSKLGLNQKIPARKCLVQVLSTTQAKEFLDINHLQGSLHARLAIGLLFAGRLVAVMTFGKPRFTRAHEWEMLRFASLAGYTVVGGASKLLRAFERFHQPRSLVSYADVRFSTGGVYRLMGFVLDHISVPGYAYLDKTFRHRLNRLRFQKKKLQKQLPYYDATLTEWQNMQIAGYDRIWDCGQMVWVKTWPEIQNG